MDFFDDRDEDAEDNEQEFMYGGRDGVIFLLDATAPMFQLGEDDEIPFKTCLKCCKTTMLNKIIGSQRDVVGIVLFGTRETANSLNAAHIVVLQDMSEPSAVKIKQLEKMIEADDFDGFADKYGHSKDFLLSDALWLCQTIFAHSAYALGTKRVFLLTNSADPHPSDPAARHQARVRASDIAEFAISLELLHMGRNFDTDLFYKELIRLARANDDDDDFELPDSATRIEELLDRVCRLDYKKRALCRMQLRLGDDVALSVILYNLVRKTARPRVVALDRSTNEPVTSKRQHFNSETAELMLPSELAKCQKWGDKKIVFSNAEVRDLLKISKPGIELLGFKPRSRVKVDLHMKPSAFIYPDDETIKGSRMLFAALLERCAARSVVAICYMTPRENSTPQLVALVAQPERLDEAGVQLVPPGFHVVYLPFKENIRSLVAEVNDRARAGNVQVAKAASIVERLTAGYEPARFDNPVLQAHWSNIEALALEHDQPRPVKDYTLPERKKMSKLMGALATRCLDSVYPPGYDPTFVKKKVYARKATGGADGESAPKAARTEASAEDVIAAVHGGKASKLTVAQLKSYLTSEGVRFASQSLKPALVALATNHAAAR